MKSRKGFTLIELLIVCVIAMIAIVGSIVVCVAVYNHFTTPTVSIEDQQRAWLWEEEAIVAKNRIEYELFTTQQEVEYLKASEEDRPALREKHIKEYEVRKAAAREEARLRQANFPE